MSSTDLTELQIRYTQMILQSGDSLLHIINNILDVSKIEAGTLELDHEPFDLRQTVEESLELLAERAHTKGLELICDIPTLLHTALRGDAGRLRQILINLIGNAVKFTDHGEIVVRVLEMDNEAASVDLRFEVKDTGIGIETENEQLIFEAFTQDDGSTISP